MNAHGGGAGEPARTRPGRAGAVAMIAVPLVSIVLIEALLLGSAKDILAIRMLQVVLYAATLLLAGFGVYGLAGRRKAGGPVEAAPRASSRPSRQTVCFPGSADRPRRAASGESPIRQAR